MENQQLIFITGGARSGKSSFAEAYAAKMAEQSDRKLYYLATSKKEDSEMADRINRHQLDRKTSGSNWETVECPTKVEDKVNTFSPQSVVLLDCLTIWLSNELYEHGFYTKHADHESIQKAVIDTIGGAINSLLHRVGVLIAVSNEVVYDACTMNQPLVQSYCKMLGLLHQKLVQQSTKTYLVELGIPLLMKEASSCEG